METATTASLELSLRNCSISSASSQPLDQQTSAADAETLQLGFHTSPCQWEQCIDFKTGDIYYIHRRTGKKVKDDPRKETETLKTDISSEEEDNSEKNNISSSPPPPSPTTTPSIDDFNYEEDVLVVAGCKRCLMYFMLPKTTEQCPKCCSTLLLHFHQPPE